MHFKLLIYSWFKPHRENRACQVQFLAVYLPLSCYLPSSYFRGRKGISFFKTNDPICALDLLSLFRVLTLNYEWL